LPPDFVLSPAFLQVIPFLIVAAFAEVLKEVLASSRPNVAASTDALTLFEALTILNPTFTLCFRCHNNRYKRSVYPDLK
jgi:hypothetical protein